MLTELDRLLYLNRDLHAKNRQQTETIQAQERVILEYEWRLARQEKRIRNLRWDCLVLAVALIIAAAAAMKGGCW